jgi:hypothetical protein
MPIAHLAEPSAGKAEFRGERIEGRGPGSVVELLAGEGDWRHG